jgi:hypothetical protein
MGMLAVECSTNRGNFGTVLDQLPLVGGYLRKVGNYIRGLGVYLGMEDATSSTADANGTSIFSTTPLFVGLATMFFMSIVPAHLMLSFGGGFDDESVAVTAMVLVFYLWTRSLRDLNSSSNNNSIISPAIGGAIAGLAYFNMVAAWGGYMSLLLI